MVKPLHLVFNVGPFGVGSSVEVINNLGFKMVSEGLYPVTFGPSTRRIVNFADINDSWSILPTGQSGNPFSPHYSDQAEMFIRGEFRRMLMDKEEIDEVAQNVLLLRPEDN